MENFLGNTRVSWMQMLLWTDRADSLMYFLMYIYLAGTRGWRLIDLLSGANLVVGANASKKKSSLGGFLLAYQYALKSDNFKSL